MTEVEKLIEILKTLPPDAIVLGAVAEDGGLQEVGWEIKSVIKMGESTSGYVGNFYEASGDEAGKKAIIFG